MIAFQLENGFLEIPPSVQIALMATNPFFDVDNVGRAYTFDFNLERSPQNDKLLKHLYRLDSTSSTTEIACNMYIGGMLYEVGLLSVQEIAAGYKCYFQSAIIAASDTLDRDLSFFVTDTLNLFTDGVTDVALEYILYFNPDGIGEDKTVEVIIRNQTFTATLYYDSGAGTYGNAATAADLVNQINAAFAPDIAASVFNTESVQLVANDNLFIEIIPVAHVFAQSTYNVVEYQHQRIVAGVQSLINTVDAPVAFPPIYAPNILIDNTVYQGFQIVNNLTSPVSLALSWYISFSPTGDETQAVQVTVRGRMFETELYHNGTQYDYAAAADNLAFQITIAFSDLNVTVSGGNTIHIESPNGSMVVINPTLGTTTGPLNSYGNSFGKLRKNSVENSPKLWANSAVPMLKVSYVLAEICTQLGFTIDGEVWADSEFKKAILFNSVTLDEVIETADNEFINRWRTNIVLSEHLPKMTAKELLNNLSRQFGIYYKPTNKRFYIRKKSDLKALKAVDWTSLLVPSSVKRVPTKKEGIRIKYQQDKDAPTNEYPDTFAPLSTGVPSDSIGDGGKDYILDFNTLPVIFHNKFGFNRLPHWWGGIGAVPKMLLILRGGTFGNSNTLTYQFATNDDANSAGVSIPNAWSLAIHGGSGLYQKHLKHIMPTLEADAVSAEFELTPEHITQLQKGEINRIISQTPLGELHAIVEQINLKISNNRVETATVDMKKI